MLDVVVPGQAAQHHQSPQPHWQAVCVAACRVQISQLLS